MVPKRPVMIACVTFETALVVEPFEHFGPSELFLFHYATEKDPGRREIYMAFYDEVVRQLKDSYPGTIIHDISQFKVWDFKVMVREISNIVTEIRRSGKDNRIVINVSSGPNEFAMAGLIVSQRNENVTAFTASTGEYYIPIDEVARIYYHDGKPVGMTKHTLPPREVPKFDLFVADENLVKGLRVFIELYDNPPHKTIEQIVAEMKKRGVWQREEGMEEAMYYSRHYKDAWLKNGWIEKDPEHSRFFAPTARGRLVAETFFTR